MEHELVSPPETKDGSCSGIAYRPASAMTEGDHCFAVNLYDATLSFWFELMRYSQRSSTMEEPKSKQLGAYLAQYCLFGNGSGHGMLSTILRQSDYSREEILMPMLSIGINIMQEMSPAIGSASEDPQVLNQAKLLLALLDMGKESYPFHVEHAFEVPKEDLCQSISISTKRLLDTLPFPEWIRGRVAYTQMNGSGCAAQNAHGARVSAARLQGTYPIELRDPVALHRAGNIDDRRGGRSDSISYTECSLGSSNRLIESGGTIDRCRKCLQDESVIHSSAVDPLVEMISASNKSRLAVAVLDSQAYSNTISLELLNDLERFPELVQDHARFLDIDGRRVHPVGRVTLQWRVLKGKKMRECDFTVLRGSPFSVVIGQPYMEQFGFLRADLAQIYAPLLDDKAITASKAANIQQLDSLS